jgi:hypothetical protein
MRQTGIEGELSLKPTAKSKCNGMRAVQAATAGAIEGTCESPQLKTERYHPSHITSPITVAVQPVFETTLEYIKGY